MKKYLILSVMLPGTLFAATYDNPTNLDCAGMYAYTLQNININTKKNNENDLDPKFLNLLNQRIQKAVDSGHFSQQGFKEAIIYRTISLAHEMNEPKNSKINPDNALGNPLLKLSLNCAKGDKL